MDAVKALGKNDLVSPQLITLREAIEAGDTEALDAFWQRTAKQGTPLIEEMADEPDHYLVTFLWQAQEPVENVAVISLLMDWGSNHMTRFPDTNLWFKSCLVRKDIRATYQLAPNDAGTPLGSPKDRVVRTANWRSDPLNPHTFVFPGIGLVRSVVELPNVPAQPWIEPRTDVPAGKIQEHQLRSDILDNERPVWVYTPPSYATGGKPHHLLLLFDGRAYIDLLPLPTILDNLISENLIPPLVAILPDSLDVSVRLRELLLNSPFNDFLADELIPWARKHYHVTDDPAKVIVGGASAGGLAAAFAGLERPDVFGNILSQSGAFRWQLGGEGKHEWLTQQFASREKLDLKFYLDAGILETNSLLALDGPNLIEANRNLRDVLITKGYHVHYAEFGGGHDYISWRGTISDGLLALLGKAFT